MDAAHVVDEGALESEGLVANLADEGLVARVEPLVILDVVLEPKSPVTKSTLSVPRVRAAPDVPIERLLALVRSVAVLAYELEVVELKGLHLHVREERMFGKRVALEELQLELLARLQETRRILLCQRHMSPVHEEEDLLEDPGIHFNPDPEAVRLGKVACEKLEHELVHVELAVVALDGEVRVPPLRVEVHEAVDEECAVV